MLRDSDSFSDGQQVNLGLTPLLAYAYTRDPVIKGDFVRQGFRADPLMILLLNDPELPAQSLDSLPLTSISALSSAAWSLAPAGTSDVTWPMSWSR